MDYFQRLEFLGERIGTHMNSEQEPGVKEHIMKIVTDFPYAGLSISFIAMDGDSTELLLKKALGNVSIDDLEMLYNYDIENIPQIVKLLRERNIDKDLIKKVFEIESKDLKDKDQVKLHYFEFIDHIIEGNFQGIQEFVKNHEPYSVNYFYGLKKLIKFTFRSEPANTKYFTPLLYTVFYGKQDLAEFLIKEDMINPFSALKEPPQTFVEDENEEADELGIADDEWFMSAGSEIFALQILIGQRNYSFLEKVVFSKFQHLWHFCHMNIILDEAVCRGDSQTVDFLLRQPLLAQTFEVIRFAD